MKVKIQQFLNSGKVLLFSRLLLGSILIAASMGKIANPEAFVNFVIRYNILPENLAQPFGIFLPWVELIIGSLLVLGVFSRIASGISILLIASFMIANSCSLLGGIEASCGCFGEAMPLSPTQSLLIDGAMLLMAVPLLLRRDEPWLAVSRFPSRRGFYTVMAIILVLGSFLPQATLAAAMVNVDETPVTLSQQVASTGACGDVVGEDAENVIKVGPDASYGQDSIDQRISNSLQTSDAVFLFFYADWCGFCKKEKPIIDALEQQYSGQISFLHLSNEKEIEAFKQFGVTGFPTMYLISDTAENGDYISQKFVGFTDEVNLKASFNQIISGGGGPSQGTVSATIAPPANDPAPVLNNDYEGTCFGLSSDDPLVCNGGDCVATDTCECPDGWIGANCQLEEETEDTWTCFSKFYYDPEVCGGKGDCTEQDVCQCSEGYMGEDCTIESTVIDCSGIGGCGYYGNCVGENVCECNPGWSGTSCDRYYTCYGVPSFSPESCGVGGECVGPDTCVCDEYHYGDQCQNENMCYGEYAGDAEVCSGNGDCQADGTCICDYRYGGDKCDYRLDYCDGYAASDSSACGLYGKCVDDGTENWVCVCEDGWGGPTCSTPAICDGKWGDSACNGVYGTCVDNNVCECIYPYTGELCTELITCNSIPATDEDNVCSGFGVCTIDGTCACDDEHEGELCDTKITCDGIFYDDENVCSGSGVCTKGDVCTCDDEHTGVICSIPVGMTCGDVPYDEPQVCSGNGECVAQNNCFCQEGWGGDICESALTDSDQDGYLSDVDCNDNDGSINPGATEVCDDVDNNCDGLTDEGSVCDSDGDGTPDCDDGCPNDAGKIEPGECGCGTPDTDSDGDGVADCVDNCPDKANPDQRDSDANGIGDACDTVYAAVDIKPNSLNLKRKSNKNAITAYIELPMGAEVSQIDISTVVLDFDGSTIPAQLKPVKIADHDNDGIDDIMVKFNRQELISVLEGIDLSFWQNIAKFFGKKVNFAFTAKGYLDDGRNFIAEGTIRVIMPKKLEIIRKTGNF